MISLRTYYLEHCNKNYYHYRFFEEIKNKYYEEVPFTLEVIARDDLCVYDSEEVIMKLKRSWYPEGHCDSKDYILMTFYLHHLEYAMKDFPNELSRPTSFGEFSLTIRERVAIEDPETFQQLGKVTYQSRREKINSIEFVSTGFVENNLDQLFIKISTRNSSFLDMETDEKLKEIANALEHVLKDYEFLSISDKVEAFVTLRKVGNLKGVLQCFRHATKVNLEQREEFSSNDKSALIEIGLAYLAMFRPKKDI